MKVYSPATLNKCLNNVILIHQVIDNNLTSQSSDQTNNLFHNKSVNFYEKSIKVRYHKDIQRDSIF